MGHGTVPDSPCSITRVSNGNGDKDGGIVIHQFGFLMLKDQIAQEIRGDGKKSFT